MTRATRVRATRWLRPHIRRITREVRDVAEHTGDRAFQFVSYPDGSWLEIRVWPDGKRKVTLVDRAGRPLEKG